jgi:hypothetical protein
MSGILPFALDRHPLWSQLSREIHEAVWRDVGVSVVQIYVYAWASDWLGACKSAESKEQGEWQWLLPSLPLPPSHETRTISEKWASLAAVHDVYDLTGDKILPWPLPEDDHDLSAYTQWMNSEGGAYQTLMRRAGQLPEDHVHWIRVWLADAKDESAAERIEKKDLPYGYVPNVLPKVLEWAADWGQCKLLECKPTPSKDEKAFIKSIRQRFKDNPKQQEAAVKHWDLYLSKQSDFSARDIP